MKKPFQNGGTYIKPFQIFNERYVENDIVNLENWSQQNKAGKIWMVKILLFLHTSFPEPSGWLANTTLLFPLRPS